MAILKPASCSPRFPLAYWPLPRRTAAISPATKFGADVKIESATMVPAAANLPEHCDVRGVIWPESNFVVKLADGLEQSLPDGRERRLGGNHQHDCRGCGGSRGLRVHIHRHGPRRAEGAGRDLRLSQRHEPERRAQGDRPRLSVRARNRAARQEDHSRLLRDRSPVFLLGRAVPPAGGKG